MKTNRTLHPIGALVAAAAIALAIGCAQTTTPASPIATGEPPTISATVPIDKTLTASTNTTINATFNKAMDATSIATSFKLYQGSTVVEGIASYDTASLTANFTPTTTLAASTVYIATISTSAKATDGGVLEADYSWTFTTGTGIDLDPPTVVSMLPGENAIDAPINGSINATFSEAMNTATIVPANFTITTGGTAVLGRVTYNAATKTATFAPSANLGSSATYTATIKASVKDSAGNSMAADRA